MNTYAPDHTFFLILVNQIYTSINYCFHFILFATKICVSRAAESVILTKAGYFIKQTYVSHACYVRNCD